MSNPVVLITGGLTGIGRAAAVAFAKKGAKVVVAGRRDEAGKALVKELRSFGSEAEFINADVRKEDDVRALVDKTVARFGRLDVAVNNARMRKQLFCRAIGGSQMGAQITKTDFTCQLITITSKKSFTKVTVEIERLFQHYDIDKLRDLTAAGDAQKLAAYVKQVGEPTEFGIFFQLDQGSTMRLAGIPIESRFYLLGNATIAQGLFRYSASAGLGAPVRFCVSQRDGEATRIDIDYRPRSLLNFRS